MFGPLRYALIPTHNRPVELAACITNLAHQVDHIYVIDNASEPKVVTYGLIPPAAHSAPDAWATIVVKRDDEQPPNLARLWNLGFDLIAARAQAAGHTVWDVAVLNDDAVVPPGWFDTCAAALRAGPAVVASSDPHRTLTAPILKTAPDSDLHRRMCPWAFVARGEALAGPLRADESMRWWWFDTDLDMRARILGGTVMVPGLPVENRCANASTVGPLAEQAALDRVTFAAKWGSTPW